MRPRLKALALLLVLSSPPFAQAANIDKNKCLVAMSNSQTEGPASTANFMKEIYRDIIQRDYDGLVARAGKTSDHISAEVTGQIRDFTIRYSEVRPRIIKHLKKSALPETLRQEIQATFDQRVRRLVTEGLKTFQSSKTEDHDAFIERTTQELRAKLGEEEWKSQEEQLAEVLGPNRTEVSKLKFGELMALFIYTGGNYDVINAALRGINLEGDWSWLEANEQQRIRREAYSAEIALGVAGLNRLPGFIGRVTRVIVLDGPLLESYKEGAVVQEPGFMSTTKGENGASTFAGNAVLEIQSKTGKFIGFLNTDPEEQEVLFAPGARFKVGKISKKHGLIIVQMTEL
jgi:hypothetical protein